MTGGPFIKRPLRAELKTPSLAQDQMRRFFNARFRGPRVMKTSTTAERVRELLSYDAETGIFHWRVNRTGSAKAGKIAGNRSREGYWRLLIDGRPYQAHRIAWLHFYGFWPEHLVDHKDGDLLNNAIKNLREATSVENGRNSVAKGYCPDGYGKHIAYVYVNRKQIFLGRYETEEEAIEARRAGTQKYFGDFSLENSRGESL